MNRFTPDTPAHRFTPGTPARDVAEAMYALNRAIGKLEAEGKWPLGVQDLTEARNSVASLLARMDKSFVP